MAAVLNIMEYIKEHPYTDPTQIAEFNEVANIISCKPLHVQKTQENETLDDVSVKAPPSNVDADFSVSDVLKNAFNALFSLVPHWNVTVEEIDALSNAWGGAVDYWFPSLDEYLTPTTNALFTTGVILAPRLLVPSNTTTSAPEQPKQEHANISPQTFGSLKK